MIPMEIDVFHMREALEERQGPIQVAQLILIDKERKRKVSVTIEVGWGEDDDLEVTMAQNGSRYIGDYKCMRIFSSDYYPMEEDSDASSKC